MLGLRKTKPPLETREKAWVETRFRWFIDQLGIERLREATVILPTTEFFPEPADGTENGVRRLMDRLCDYMDVRAADLKLEICDEVQMGSAVGQYERHTETESGKRTIRVRDTELSDTESLVATLAHELSHEILLHGGYIDEEHTDHEWITDLLPVFLGVGIFAANSTVRETNETSSGWSWWSIRRRGYLEARLFGYGFAMFAWLRGETKPDWLSYVRLDAASVCRSGLKYLARTGDSLITPDASPASLRTPSKGQPADELRSNSPSRRMAALWDIANFHPSDENLATGILNCLADDDPALRTEAAILIGNSKEKPEAALPQLRVNLREANETVRAGAVFALGTYGIDTEEMIDEITVMLDDDDRDVVQQAAIALQSYGPRAARSIRVVMPALRRAIIHCTDAIIDELLATLGAMTDDPASVVEQYFHDDAELAEVALQYLEEMETQPAADGRAAIEKE